MDEQVNVKNDAGAQSRAGEAGANLTVGLGEKPGQLFLHHDDVSNRLDEMADLCEHWKLWREGREYTPQAVRAALVMLAREVTMLDDLEKKHGPRVEPI